MQQFGILCQGTLPMKSPGALVSENQRDLQNINVNLLKIKYLLVDLRLNNGCEGNIIVCNHI